MDPAPRKPWTDLCWASRFNWCYGLVVVGFGLLAAASVPGKIVYLSLWGFGTVAVAFMGLYGLVVSLVRSEKSNATEGAAGVVLAAISVAIGHFTGWFGIAAG